MKQLPNMISCIRIVLSIMLLFLINIPSIFVIIYFLCGISDVVDGYLARLLDAETMVGAKLDSLGDFTFFMVWLFILITFLHGENNIPIIICSIIVAVIRIINLIITKVKFKQWNIIHTIGNKLTGLIMFFMLPIYSFAKNIPFWSVIVIGVIAIISSLEESLILLKSKSYDANRKSILSLVSRYNQRIK